MPAGHTEARVSQSTVTSLKDYLVDDHGFALVEFGSTPDLEGEHKYGWVNLDQQGEVVRVVRRTNPNYHWDWHELGGRWTGFFKLKDGCNGQVGKPGLMTDPAPAGFIDAALKSAIDFDYKIAEAQRQAEAAWAKIERYAHFAKQTLTWSQCREKFNDDIEKAREFYHAQSLVDAVKTAFNNDFWVEPDEFICTKDEYIERKKLSANTTFAIVKDGQWFERGEMGWWGTVSNGKDKTEWGRELKALIDSLSDDTLLSVYDCHI